jgi:tRNA U34 2-thiouridine synthase MnmA/TrmU
LLCTVRTIAAVFSAKGLRSEVMKAAGLFSGGLDSCLAVSIVRNMGVEVEALHFHTGLHSGTDSEVFLREVQSKGESLGLRVKVVDISEELLHTILHPRFGYGSGMNPCLDCRLLMLMKARDYLKESGAKFVVTGEVLGQRPMSQYRNALTMLEKESGLHGLILRPLSGRLLPETVPEKEGWVKREELFAIQGKSRKEQIALAEQMGVVKYSQPAGGCILTDANFSRKLRDIISHRETVTAEDLAILKVGRHLRISDDLKAVVGRNHSENAFLEKHRSGRWSFRAVDYKGPLTLLEGEPGGRERDLVAGITARYSDGAEEPVVRIRYEKNGETGEVSVVPAGRETIADWFI